MIRTIAAIVLSLLVSGFHSASAGTEPSRWRALHLIGYNDDAALQALGAQVPELAKKGINVIILEVNYHFAYRSHPELREGSDPITLEGARRLTAVCRANGIWLIPQFQCLGHQSWKARTAPLLTKYPELDLTPGAFPGNKDIYCREWNPLDPRVNKIVFALMDELIDAFQADAMHVGMDEVFLLGSKKSPATRGKDPAKIFAKAVIDYYSHLTRQRRVQMLMWADRLLDGKKLGMGAWEASVCGTAGAVDLIPRDIILCPWHYGKRATYPSIPFLTKKGFRVLPSSWKDVEATKALIQYSQAQKDSKIIGHMFTTWGAVPRDKLLEFPAMNAGLPLLK